MVEFVAAALLAVGAKGDAVAVKANRAAERMEAVENCILSDLRINL